MAIAFLSTAISPGVPMSDDPPLTAAERHALHGWSPETFAYLRQRAAEHGLSPEQLLAEFPPHLRHEALVSASLPDLEISHRISQAVRPDLANDPSNLQLELCSELGGRNQQRGSSSMGEEEMADVRRQTEAYLMARQAELRGEDPLSLGEPFSSQLPIATSPMDPSAHGQPPELNPEAGSPTQELITSQLAAFSAEAGWQQGLSHISDHVLQSLSEMGIPVASVTIRGAAALWPFLRSVDLRRFCTDWRYSLKTLNRAMRIWREGGWREASKALLLGILIAHVPHLASLVSALGLAGLGALGVRWLASRRFMRNTCLAPLLHRLADGLVAVVGFLRQAFQLVEVIADVAIEAASRVVKHVLAAAAPGLRQLGQTCRSLAGAAFAASGRAMGCIDRVASGFCSWVSGWFAAPPQSAAVWANAHA